MFGWLIYWPADIIFLGISAALYQPISSLLSSYVEGQAFYICLGISKIVELVWYRVVTIEMKNKHTSNGDNIM